MNTKGTKTRPGFSLNINTARTRLAASINISLLRLMPTVTARGRLESYTCCGSTRPDRRIMSYEATVRGEWIAGSLGVPPKKTHLHGEKLGAVCRHARQRLVQVAYDLVLVGELCNTLVVDLVETTGVCTSAPVSPTRTFQNNKPKPRTLSTFGRYSFTSGGRGACAGMSDLTASLQDACCNPSRSNEHTGRTRGHWKAQTYARSLGSFSPKRKRSWTAATSMHCSAVVDSQPALKVARACFQQRPHIPRTPIRHPAVSSTPPSRPGRPFPPSSARVPGTP